MKGVYPFIAAILLIAFVITIGSLASPWFVSFTKTRSGEVEDISEGQIDCIFSSIEFTASDIEYNLTGTSDSLNITLDNTGSTPLYDFEIVLRVSDETWVYEPKEFSKKNSEEPLEAGETFVIVTNITNNLSDNLQKVRVVAKNCPREARKEVTL